MDFEYKWKLVWEHKESGLSMLVLLTILQVLRFGIESNPNK
jgi:hypothetical protein